MGYNTYYILSVEDEIPEALLKEEVIEGWEVYLESTEGTRYLQKHGKYATDFDGEFKWYDHESDMKKLSLKFPDVVFKLYGSGEETGDIWIKFFKGGKIQSWHLDLEEITSQVKFNPEELEEINE